MVRDVAHASNQWPSVNAEKAPVASLSGDVDEVPIASCCFLDGDPIASHGGWGENAPDQPEFPNPTRNQR